MLFAIVLYFVVLAGLVAWSGRKVKSSTDFIIGGRGMNFWLTAMAAHASDMSSWLFMGYPALIFAGGLYKAWVAIGLIIGMGLNWQFVAAKLRTLTGEWNCSTFSSFLHRRYQDDSGSLQLFSALFSFLFYSVYICAGLTGLGILGQSLFGVSYATSIQIGTLIVIAYVILGGFITLAWIDLVQGLFLLAVIVAVPFAIIYKVGGFEATQNLWVTQQVDLHLLPTSGFDALQLCILLLSWGLGYFGQPHIVTKFMGIKNPAEISKSRNVGMAWMILSLAAATLVGLVGVSFFQGGLADAQMVFIEMAKQTFSPFLVGLILCAVLAATINVMSSQLLILSSILTEDVYKRFCKTKDLSPKHLLAISRLWIVFAGLMAYAIASLQLGSIYTIVQYAWAGLGASFGPIMLVALYSKKTNKYGALAGILVGGVTAALWHTVNPYLPLPIDALIPGFLFSTLSIFIVSALTRTEEASLPYGF